MTRSERFHAVASAAAFVLVAIFLTIVLALILRPIPFMWSSFLGVLLATVIFNDWLDRVGVDLALGGRAAEITRRIAAGCLWAVLLATVSDLLAHLGNLRHGLGGRINFAEIGALFVPAALQEELLVRGYAFQKLLTVNRWFAVGALSFVFTALHIGNRGLGPVGILNIFLAGVVLSLAVIWTRSLWFAMSAHLSWNVAIGPVLGHEVSGYRTSSALLTTIDRGPQLLTGGTFGLEGSLCVTAVATVATTLLIRQIAKNQRQQQTVLTTATPHYPESQ